MRLMGGPLPPLPPPRIPAGDFEFSDASTKPWLERRAWPAPAPFLARAGLSFSTRAAYAESIHRYYAFARQWHWKWTYLWSEDGVGRWVEDMVERGNKARTIARALAALKCFASALSAAGHITPAQRSAISSLRPSAAKFRGASTGNWLTRAQARTLIEGIQWRKDAVGRRDLALVAMMLGAGLRVSEAAGVQIRQYVLRDGRRVFADVTGKHGRVRTVPVPVWAAGMIEDWLKYAWGEGWEGDAEIASSPIVYSLSRIGGARYGQPLRRQSIYAKLKKILKRARMGGMRLSPHDLRRTFARLAREGGAPIEQIQYALGHESPVTTARYIGALRLDHAACDVLGLDKEEEEGRGQGQEQEQEDYDDEHDENG